MLRLRHLRLRAITRTSTFGADIPFAAGLNVIHAGNTSGKSTCLQAMVYALGLERALGPQLEIPLPYAMRERIHRHSDDDDYEPVIESYVELEVENQEGAALTVHRDVVGGKDTKLIQAWDSLRITSPSVSGTQRDFFVHDPGAAQREDGFHNYLARFMGWELPSVPRFDGSEGPLYLEAIFPMMFVEQKRGWSAVQGPFPTYMRIQDIARRVMEFLLDLEVGRIRASRSEIQRQLSALSQLWSSRRSALESQMGPGMRLQGLPAAPTAEFSHAPAITIQVLQDENWVEAETVIAQNATRVDELNAVEIPSSDEIAPEIEKQLAAAREKLDELTARQETVRNELSIQIQEYRAIESRVGSLKIDLRRNQDALKLRDLGSTLGRVSGEGVCPTCHQSVSGELLLSVSSEGMGLEENVLFVKSQLDLYQTMFDSSSARVGDLRASYTALDQQSRDLRQEIRGLRQALLQPASSPSRAIIEEIIRRQSLIEGLRRIIELADGMRDEFQSIAANWSTLQDRLKRLPPGDLTEDDGRKLNALRDAIREHLTRYGFRSFRPNEIVLSQDNFRTLITTIEDGVTVEREIGFEVSASDAIRLKWAYYLSLLSLAKIWKTNHSNLLIFDEPGQQEIETPSLHSFLQWSVGEVSDRQQVIVATSEPRESLDQVLSGTRANLISFAGFILQPVRP